MCISVCYKYNNKKATQHFRDPEAILPVLLKNKEVMQVAWGRRQHQVGNLPMGGWAHLIDIKEGRWDKYFAKAVKLPIESFMERDIEGKTHWFDVTAGQYIQGLLAHYDKEQRVYIVVIQAKSELAIYERWPRLICH